MVADESPPPYDELESIPPPPFFDDLEVPPTPSLSTLPSHLLFKIVHATFSQTVRLERQHRTLHWLAHELRLVNRAFYAACMHVLRTAHLPAYRSLIRAPYTSDPLPPHRETHVLDLFIALKVRQDVLAHESALHLAREESFRDLFDLMQPRSRLEDLVCAYGVREGVVCVGEVGERRGVPFGMLSVSFSPRRVGLVVTDAGRRRTVLEVVRTREERVEVTAGELVERLKAWLRDAEASRDRW